MLVPGTPTSPGLLSFLQESMCFLARELDYFSQYVAWVREQVSGVSDTPGFKQAPSDTSSSPCFTPPLPPRAPWRCPRPAGLNLNSQLCSHTPAFWLGSAHTTSATALLCSPSVSWASCGSPDHAVHTLVLCPSLCWCPCLACLRPIQPSKPTSPCRCLLTTTSASYLASVLGRWSSCLTLSVPVRA